MATLTFSEALGRTAAVTRRYVGATWHAATYPYRATLHAVRRTTRRMAMAYREALSEAGDGYGLAGGPAIDSDDWSYRRLSQTKRDLPALSQSRLLELANHLYNSNPVARRILELTRDFVLGEGAIVHSDVAEVDAVLQAFWTDPVNDLDAFKDDLALELGKTGEVFLPAFVNPTDGAVRLGWLDPSSVEAVLCDPQNCRRAIAVKVKKGPMQWDYLHVIRQQDDPQAPGYGKLMPAQEGDGIVDPAVSATTPQPYVGSCFVFQINKSPAASRGTSDLRPLIDWLDNFDQALWNELDRMGFAKAFVWDILCTGMDDAAIGAYMAKQPAHKPGMEFYHNEKIVRTAVTPKLEMADSSEGIKMMLNQLMGGAGLPAHWYGANADVNLATATAMDAPTLKRMTQRQRVVKRLLETPCRFAVDQAVLAGQLDEEYPVLDELGDKTTEMIASRDAVGVNLPELSGKDTASLSTALLQLAQALLAAVEGHLLSERTAREVLASLITQLGVEVDLDEEETAIEQARAQAEEEAAQQAEQEQANLRARMQMGPPPGVPRVNGAPPPAGTNGKPPAVPALSGGR